MAFVWFLLVLYLVGVAVAVVLTHLLYFYEVVKGPGLDWLRSQTGRPPAVTVPLGMLRGYVSQLMVALFYLPGFITRLWFPPRAPDPAQPAVLLVHGLYHNASAWTIFKQRLKSSGFKNIYALTYLSWGTDFFSIYKKLEECVEEVARQCPNQGILLVGHSLGGLLTRHYMAVGARRGEVRTAVTLGAPHSGSCLAALGIGRLARSLLHRDELACRLDELDSAPPAPCLSLWSPCDEFVTPPESLRISVEGWEERRTRCLPHVSMLFDASVASEAIGFLQLHATGKD